MVGVAFILHWNIIWWYFVLAIFAYSIVIIFLTYEEERAKKQSEGRAGEYESSQEQAYREQMRFEIFRWLLGCHIAFLLLAGGLWLNAGNFFVQVGIFIAA